MADPFFDSLNKSIDNLVPLAMKKWEIDRAADALKVKNDQFNQTLAETKRGHDISQAANFLKEKVANARADTEIAKQNNLTADRTAASDIQKTILAGNQSAPIDFLQSKLPNVNDFTEVGPDLQLGAGAISSSDITTIPGARTDLTPEQIGQVIMTKGTPAQQLQVALKQMELGKEKPTPLPRAVTPGSVLVDAAGNTIFANPAKAGSEGKPPSGYRTTADGNLEPVPGAPADFKMQQQFTKDAGALEGITADLDRLGSAAKQLKDHPGLPRITGIMGKIPNIPGSDAANAEGLLGTLKSQTAFSVLQTMRNNSKTGGALGQVSDKEGQLLQDNLAALDKAQSTEAYKKALQQIIDYTDGAKTRTQRAYDLKWATKAPSSNQAGFDNKVPQAAIDFLKKHPDKAAAFDAKYGNGNKVSQHFLGGK